MAQAQIDITIDQRSAVPLYEQICQQIRQKIESRQLQPGTPLPTNHELRTRLAVNYKTAHQAMATLAKEGYVTRQARRGTVVKGIPRRGVVAIYSHIDLISQDGKYEFYRLITSYLSSQLGGRGRVHRLYLGSPDLDAPNAAGEDLLRHLSSGVLCGAMLVNPPPHMATVVAQGRSLRVPVVALSGSGQADYSVRVDHLEYVRTAAAYLRQQGRRRVGVIFNSSSSAFREPGVIAQTLEQTGCTPQALWIVGRTGSEQGGYEATTTLPLTELDGLIVEDDLMAVGADQRLCELNVNMPRDLMGVTFWNHGSRLRLTLPFERFELDVARHARLSLQLMQDAINGQRITEPHLQIVPTRFGSRQPE